VVGVLIEVPVMLMLVKFCLRTQGWFEHESVAENGDYGRSVPGELAG
jgi:hypothetical protein